MIILVLNCGSSSLKYQLLDMRSAEDYTLMKKGLVERIGDVVPDHAAGIKMVLDALVSPEEGVIDSLERIDAVGHRVAHGGEFFDCSVRVTPEVMDKIERCCELAPLHNPANLMGIKAIEQLMPGEPQVAVFDTSFHQTMPDYAYMYAIPYRFYEQYRLRRYGFHGTSHKYVAEKACKFVGLNLRKSRIITCHLGNGSSITAIKDGESVDTSMGFTPVEGVVMGTRCGNLDVGAVTFIQEKENLDYKQVNSLLNKKSGLLGISGVSSDNRDIEAAAATGNERAQLAKKMLSYSIKKYVGAYAAALGGVDLIVFTGGIGENAWPVREEVCTGLEFLGVDFDAEANKVRGKDVLLTRPGSKVKVVAVTTNEELVIATDTMNIVNNN
ncbi:MAG: acetate kinase [Bacteroidales bacterium]|nr:acetate kinase [Bacteroidales bacterium]